MSKKNKTKNTLVFLIKISIAIGILIYLFKKIPISEVFSALSQAKIAYVSVALLLQFSMRFFSAIQLRLLLKHQNINFTILELVKINFVVQFYSLFLPSELSGGLVKWHKLSRDNNMRSQTFISIALSRIINVLCLAVLGIIFFWIELPLGSLAIGLCLLTGLLISTLTYLSIINEPISNFLENLSAKLFSLNLLSFLKQKSDNLWSSIRRFHSLPLCTLNFTLFLSLLFHLFGITSIYLIIQSLGIKISILPIVWIRAAVVFVQMLPVSISGLGVREGAFVVLLGRYEIAPSYALATSLIIFSITLFMASFGGLFELKEFLLKNEEKEKVG